MVPRRKPVTCFTLNRRSEHRYWHLYLRVFQARPELVKEKLEGTVDNKSGYGSPEAAKELGRWFNHLLEEGHRIVLDPMTYEASFPSTTLEWMEIPADPAWASSSWSYSDGTVDSLGDDKFTDIQRGAKFLQKLGRKVAIVTARTEGREDVREPGNWVLNDPTVLIETLEAMKAKRVELLRGTALFPYMSAWVYAQGPRQHLISDTLNKTFELGS